VNGSEAEWYRTPAAVPEVNAVKATCFELALGGVSADAVNTGVVKPVASAPVMVAAKVMDIIKASKVERV
jgi:hypothetical protein